MCREIGKNGGKRENSRPKRKWIKIIRENMRAFEIDKDIISDRERWRGKIGLTALKCVNKGENKKSKKIDSRKHFSTLHKRVKYVCSLTNQYGYRGQLFSRLSVFR